MGRTGRGDLAIEAEVKLDDAQERNLRRSASWSAGPEKGRTLHAPEDAADHDERACELSRVEDDLPVVDVVTAKHAQRVPREVTVIVPPELRVHGGAEGQGGQPWGLLPLRVVSGKGPHSKAEEDKQDAVDAEADELDGEADQGRPVADLGHVPACSRGARACSLDLQSVEPRAQEFSAHRTWKSRRREGTDDEGDDVARDKDLGDQTGPDRQAVDRNGLGPKRVGHGAQQLIAVVRVPSVVSSCRSCGGGGGDFRLTMPRGRHRVTGGRASHERLDDRLRSA
jgi:hypothetical protein